MTILLYETYLLSVYLCSKLPNEMFQLWAAVNPQNVAKPLGYLEMLNWIFGEIGVEDKAFEVT